MVGFTNFPDKFLLLSERHMASPGVGLSNNTQSSITNLVEQKLRAERVVKAGASWFLMVGVLSLVNSVLSMSGAGIRFIFGLGIAQFVDGLARQAGQTGFALSLVINGGGAACVGLFRDFSRQSGRRGVVVGIGLGGNL